MDAPTLAPEKVLAEIESAVAANNRNRAIDLAVNAMGSGLATTLILTLVAEGMEADGLVPDALAILNRAQFEAPDDIDAKLRFAAALMRHGADEEAIAPLEAVLARQTNHFEGLMLRGNAAVTLKALGDAQLAFEKARLAQPQSDTPLIELAVLAAQRGDMETARRFGAHAAALNPGAARAVVAIARADLAEGNGAAAEARLRKVLNHPRLLETDRAEVLNALGDALDSQGQAADAFTAWRERERVLRPSRARALAQGAGEEHIALAQRLHRWFSAVPKGAWRAAPQTAPADDAAPLGHVFVLSFPRSGTTLLQHLLAGHPDIVALDESPALGMASDYFMADDASLADLRGLTGDAALACRDAYWARVRQELGGELTGKVFVDKNPLNSVRLPIIAKLFPKAKILFAERDPRDVVLSGYRRLYYSKILAFHSLEGTARFYDAVMRLTDLYRDRLELPLLTVRHETLVSDFEACARSIIADIGLDWDPAVLDFARRPVKSTTPSAAQVTKGLNADGVGLWKSYVREMAGVRALLDPWIERFGYEATPLAAGPPAPTSPAPTFDVSPPVAAALNAIQASLNAGQTAQAMRISAEALARGLTHPLFHRLRGVEAEQAGRLDAAIMDFETAHSLEGDEPQLLNVMGICLARAGQARKGLDRLDRAIALKGDTAVFHYNRGWSLEALGDVAGARESYETAARLNPNDARTLGALAVLAARRADWNEARTWSARAHAIDSNQPAAALALARTEAAEGDPQAARVRLESLLAKRHVTAHEKAVALNALGDCLDQLDQPDAAFVAYADGAKLLAELYAAQVRGAPSNAALAERLAEDIRLSPAKAWQRSAPHGSPVAKAHVFLLGFPRSGTTMLGQALAGHPEVETLDEKPTLTDAAEVFTFPTDGLERLMAAGEADLQPLREAYWRRVREGGAAPEGKVFIDKLPMNTLGLPLIRVLFPEGKVIFLRRDPRDVLLSCLRRQFVVDATTAELHRPDSAARLYDRVMGLMEVARERLGLTLREQSYEALVENFDTEMGELCGFLGLDFSSSMKDFASRSGLVATPSAAQLAKGLSREGIGVWRRYRQPLAPIMDVLAPWVARFGYPED